MTFVEKPTVKDVLPLAAYDQVRDDYRRSIIDEKAKRRVHIGDRITLLFENRRLVLYQVQEMCRAEKLSSPEAIQAEIDAYSDLLPGPSELSATLFVEIPDQSIARRELDKLIGIDEHVYLKVGDHSAIQAHFEPGHMTRERIAAVQYIRFRLDAATRADFISGDAEIRVGVDHPNLKAEATLPDSVREALAADLARE